MQGTARAVRDQATHVALMSSLFGTGGIGLAVCVLLAIMMMAMCDIERSELAERRAAVGPAEVEGLVTDGQAWSECGRRDRGFSPPGESQGRCDE